MKTHKGKWTALLAVALISLGLGGVALAGYVKVSGDMPAYGSISRYELSPDGRYAVYTADQELDGAFNIYSVLLPDGAPVRLGSALPAGSGVVSFQISQDSQWVVYLAPSTSAARLELFSAPIGGPASAAVQLTTDFYLDKHIESYAISPDGQWVVYLADQVVSYKFELFSVPLRGPADAARKISGSIPFNESRVFDFVISPDSSQVAYRADAEIENLRELYSTSISGETGPVVKLSVPGTFWGVEPGYQISPDSSRVVYLINTGDYGYAELFSVPLEGPASAGVTLNLPLETWATSWNRPLSAHISPDSQWVVYWFMQKNAEGFYEYFLYSVPLEGPWEDSIPLHPSFGSKKGALSVFQIAPDSSRVIFLANLVTNSPEASLYSSPIRGPESEAIRLDITGYPFSWVGGMSISPDSQTVVYKVTNWGEGGGSGWSVPELYSVPVQGPASASIKLSGVYPLDAQLLDFQISLDSRRVVYLADQQVGGVFELFSLPIQGPAHAAVKVSGPLVENGQVRGFTIHPDSSRILYLADQEAAGRRELYLADDGLTLVRFTASAAVYQASSGKILLPLELSQAAALPVQVFYEVTGGTLGSEHYTLTPGPLVFPSGATTAQIELTLSPGLVLKNDETLEISLISALNASIGEPARMMVTITPDSPVLPFFVDIFLPLVSRQP